MRWQALFEDLEAQFLAAEAADFAAEVRDRTRRELGSATLVDRLAAVVGATLVLELRGAGTMRGRLTDTGPDWLLLQEQEAGRDLLVPLGAVRSLTGLTARMRDPAAIGEVVRRLDLRWALRGLARSRTGVTLLVDVSTLSGTLDRIGADHLDLAEHPAGEPRRAGEVRQVRTVPLVALAAVRSQ